MTKQIGDALERLAGRVQAGERPVSVELDGEAYELSYDEDDYGEFVEVALAWPQDWYGALEDDTWGGQVGVRYYFDRWEEE